MIDQDFYLEEFNPERILTNLGRRHDKSIYITENGAACKDDRSRNVFLAECLSAIQEPMRFWADVRGYLYWSMLDNIEWGNFKPTFSLYGVDFETFEGTAEPSVSFYCEIIESNGFNKELIRKYLKGIPFFCK